RGVYALTLPGEGHFLAADARGYAPSHAVWFPGSPPTIDFKLNPAARARGHVVRRDGAPVAGAEVHAEVVDRPFEDHVTTSDARGAFELTDLDPGEDDVWAKKGSLIGSARTRLV